VSIDPPKSLPAVPESLLPREHALYRPRHSARQRTASTLAVIFFCAPALMLLGGVRPAEFENRRLADFPSITAGWGFFTGLDAWANDHIPLRDHAVAAANGISRGVFGEPPPVARPHRDQTGPIPLPPKDPSLDQPEPTAYVRVIEGKGDWLYLGEDIERPCEPTLPVPEVFDRLRSLRAAVESSGRKLVLVVAPDKVTTVPQNLPAKYFGAECAKKARDDFWRSVTGKTGALDLRDGLRAAAEDRKAPVYQQLDSHWTTEGGLVMVRAIAEAIQPGVTRTWDFRAAGSTETKAGLPPLLGRSATMSVNHYDLAPDGKTVRDKKLSEPFPEPRRSTQSPGTGVVRPKVLVIGDSFATPMAGYLSASFADITFMHLNTASTDPVPTSRMMAAADVVVIEVVERNMIAGNSAVLSIQNIETFQAELARQPR
jgi:alginate O-acetyltransferase complex protein AlgJ